MFLGIYRFEGSVERLRAAYEKLLASMPHDGLHLHVGVFDAGGLWIYDACPSRAIFESFAASTTFRDALAAAGLPKPAVTPVGEVHRAFVAGKRVV